MSDTPRLYLIDGSGYLYRAFYGVRNLSRRDGFPTNAIFGFIKMVRKVVEEAGPDYLAMVFDHKGPTFRHEMDENYKGNRKAMPDELHSQVPIIKQVVDAYRIPQFELAGYEADDIIGTIASRAAKEGMQVVIVTGDKDLMQLVNDRVSMMDTSRDTLFTTKEVETHWGVPPEKVVDVMGLSGDASDNIPGVPGIGIKTAAQLIQTYGDLDTLLNSTSQIKQPKRREKLIQFADDARLSRALATIKLDVPLSWSLDKLKLQSPNIAELHRIYKEMEFNTLIRELDYAVEDENLSGGPVLPEPEREPIYHTITTPNAWQTLLATLKKQKSFSIDTETTGVDPVQAELVGVSLAWEAYEAYYIPVAHTPDAAPDGQLDRQTVLSDLKPILEDASIALTGQNIKYEYVLFRRYDITLSGLDRDSMLISHLIHGPARRHNLDAIALEELGRTTITYKEVAGTGKKQLRFDQVPLEKAAPYACEDAEVTWQAAEKMAPQLAALESVQKLYQEVELPLIPVLAEMEIAGTCIDKATLATMSADFTKRRAKLVEEIHALAGEAFNVNSPKQLGEILFGKMGIKGGRKTKTGYSTNVNVLTRLADQGHDLPARVLTYRSLTKLQSTYTDALMALINPETGRVHTSFNQAVTLTGRLSSSDPNLQNIPIRTEEGRAIRTAFIAPKGWKLLSADYSQIELRLLAHLGDVPRLKEAFLTGQDIHSATASEIFGVNLEQVDDDKRRMAKTINFGLIYGMSPFGLAKRLGISNMEARHYMDLYFKKYAGVRAFMDRTIVKAREQGYVQTLAGRRCRVPDIENRNRNLREFAERTAINAPLQGSAADLIKIAMIRLHHRLKEDGFNSRMVLQVHDELMLEVPEDELETVQPVIREAMEGAMSLSIPLVVDIGIGMNWAEAH
ncbi:MAG: DNA polymerase I [Magnetococcales bacterium]|nr:DNA polymerase I [Magnetococcales bacterium]